MIPTWRRRYDRTRRRLILEAIVENFLVVLGLTGMHCCIVARDTFLEIVSHDRKAKQLQKLNNKEARLARETVLH